MTESLVKGMAGWTKICGVCGVEQRLTAFPANKHRPDGSGRASMCSGCLERLNLHKRLATERRLDRHDASDAVQERRARAEVRRADKEARAAVAAAARAELQAEAEHARTATKRCATCGVVKELIFFPKNQYNIFDGGEKRSRTCLACYAAMPDGKAALNKERGRDYYQLYISPSRHATAASLEQQRVQSELVSTARLVGITPEELAAERAINRAAAERKAAAQAEQKALEEAAALAGMPTGAYRQLSPADKLAALARRQGAMMEEG